MKVNMIRSMVYKTNKYNTSEKVEDFSKEIGIYHTWSYFMDMKETGQFDTYILLDKEFKSSNDEEMEELKKYVSRFIKVMKREYKIELYNENIKTLFEHQMQNRVLKISVKE